MHRHPGEEKIQPMSVYPVILCGGSGTRLWPASRPDRPKQFINLIGDQSSFQHTVRRVSAMTCAF